MKALVLYLMAAAYLLAGINHFWHPETYYKIMPHWVAWPRFVNIVSGIFEIVFALLLLPATTRNTAAWGLIALLILIFPANIQMAVDYNAQGHPSFWLSLLRLPLQFVLIWWAYTYTNQYAFYKSKRVYQ